MKTRLFFHFLLTAFVLCVLAAGVPAKGEGVAVDESTFSQTADSVALRVYFHCNKTNIDPAWRGNREHMQAFAQSLRQLMADSLLTPGDIYVAANASLEGPQWNNDRLARERARVVVKWMARELGLDPNNFIIHTEGEDWHFFEQLATADENLPFRARVLSIIDSPLKGRKERLHAVGGKQLYNYLLKDIYRSMRCTAVRIKFSAVKRIHEAQLSLGPINPAPLATPATLTPPDSLYLDVAPYQPHESLPLLAVKTNLLYYALYTPHLGYQPMPNVELEWYSRGGRWAIWAEFDTPWWRNWKKKTFFEIQNWTVEPRYYLKKDRLFTGHFLGAYAQYNRYDVCLKAWDGDGYQGEAGGIGLSYGYVIPLGNRHHSRWTIELNVKAGFWRSYYDPYVAGTPYHNRYYYDYNGDVSLFKRRNWRKNYFGPTAVGIHISYDLLRRKP